MPTTVYANSDPLSPVLTAESGKLIKLFDKCLVDGFGSKSAAGWQKVFYDAVENKAVYKQPLGSNEFYLHIFDNDPLFARVFMSEECSGFDDIANKFPSESNFSGGLYIYKSYKSTSNSDPANWKIIHNSKYGGFYLWVDTYDSIDNNVCFSYFGDFKTYLPTDSFNSICAAQKIKAGNKPDQNIFLYSGTLASPKDGSYCARRYTQAQGDFKVPFLIQSLKSSNTGLAGSKGASYPDPITGGLLYSDIKITEIEDGTPLLRGELPGILAPMHDKPLSNFDTFETQEQDTYIALPLRAYNDTGQVFVCISEWG